MLFRVILSLAVLIALVTGRQVTVFIRPDHRIRALYSLAVFSVVAGQSATPGTRSKAPSLPVSPCPNIFNYENRSMEPGKWYGVINLSTESTLYSLWLNIVLDNKADILGNWVGEVSTKDHIDFKVENTKMQIVPGPAIPVRFFIQYNPSDDAPRLKYIRLNGKEICNVETKTTGTFNEKLILGRTEDTNVGSQHKAKVDTNIWTGTNKTTTWKPVSLERVKSVNDQKVHTAPQVFNTSTTSKKNNNNTTSKPYGWDTKIGANTAKIDFNSGMGSISSVREKERPFYTITGSNSANPSYSENNDFTIDASSKTESSSISVNKDKIFNYKTDSNNPINNDKNRFNSQSNFDVRKDSNFNYNTKDRYDIKLDVDAIRSIDRIPETSQSVSIQDVIDNYGPLYEKPTEFEQVIPTSPPSNDFVITTSTTTTRRTTYSKGPFEIESESELDIDTDTDDYDDNVGGIPTIYIPSSVDSSSANSQKVQCGKVAVSSSNPILDEYGSPTLEGQYPWQIALYKTHRTADNKYICGGTLVTRRHVITAAHCVTRRGTSKLVNKNTLTMYLGKNNLRTSVEGVQIKLVDNIIVHPDYNATVLSRDLAILQLREPITYSDHVRPVCLWPENVVHLGSIVGKSGSLVGWGSDESGATKQELSLVKMPVVDKDTCIKSYSAYIARIVSEQSYCATYAEGTSACNGDSGGGMVFRSKGSWYLRGVASLSVARQNHFRCDPKHYVIFTDVAKFLPWIKHNIYDY